MDILKLIAHVIPEFVVLIFLIFSGFIGIPYANHVIQKKIQGWAKFKDHSSDVEALCRYYTDLDILFSSGVLTCSGFLVNIITASESTETYLVISLIIYVFLVAFILFLYSRKIKVSDYSYQGILPRTTKWSLLFKAFLACVNIGLSINAYYILKSNEVGL